MVVGDENHMVSVDEAEGYQSISHDGEESNEDIVDYINDIVFSSADIDPADQEKYPCETKESNQRCIKCDEESES